MPDIRGHFLGVSGADSVCRFRNGENGSVLLCQLHDCDPVSVQVKTVEESVLWFRNEFAHDPHSVAFQKQASCTIKTSISLRSSSWDISSPIGIINIIYLIENDVLIHSLFNTSEDVADLNEQAKAIFEMFI